MTHRTRKEEAAGDLFISPAEFAARAGCNVKTVYEGLASGQIPGQRVGTRWLVRVPAPASNSAVAQPISALRRARADLWAEVLARQPGRELTLDPVGYGTAAAVGLSPPAVDQATDDLGNRVTVRRDGKNIVVRLADDAARWN